MLCLFSTGAVSTWEISGLLSSIFSGMMLLIGNASFLNEGGAESELDMGETANR